MSWFLTRTGYFGWWHFDKHDEAMEQAHTKQRLHFICKMDACEELRLSNSENQYWLRFDYQDETTNYPLLVEWRYMPRESFPDRRCVVWRLDYNRSLQLHHREQGDATPPPFGLWHKIDRFTIDALACWPLRIAIGPGASEIAAEGGWLNGVWQKHLYRMVAAPTPAALKQGAKVIARPIPTETEPYITWQFQPAQKPLSPQQTANLIKQIGAVGPLGIESLLESLALARPHLRSEDGHNIAIPLSCGHSSGGLLWLYADPDYITDRLRFATGTEYAPNRQVQSKNGEWRRLTDNVTLLGTIDRQRHRYVALKQNPRHPDRHDLQRGLSLEHNPLPKKLRNRIEAFCRNAIWEWQESEIALPPLNEKDDPETLTLLPAQCWSEPFHFGGTSARSSITTYSDISEITYPSLSETSYPHPLLYCFENKSGYIETGTHMWRKGNFELDPGYVALRDRKTKQTFRFIRRLAQDSVSQRGPAQRLFFHYEDEENQYPIIVTRHYVPNDEDSAATQRRQAPAWMIDYRNTLEELSKRGASFADRLPCRFWHKMNACVTDAMLCWPEIEATGPAPALCITKAGWLGGLWNDQVVRSAKPTTVSINGQDEPVAVDLSTENPFSTASFTWNCPQGRLPLNRPESYIDLNFEPKNVPHSGNWQDILVQRLDNRPYIIRSDSKAILFICRFDTVRSGPEGDEKHIPVFQYCDEDISIKFKRDYRGEIHLKWLFDPVEMPGSIYASAGPNGTPSTFVSSNAHYPSFAPSHILWWRLLFALEGMVSTSGPHWIDFSTMGRWTAGNWQPYTDQSLRIEK